jgi:uncharacterized protein YjbI with pentapeptide repeats
MRVKPLFGVGLQHQGDLTMFRKYTGLEAAAYLLAEYKTGKRRFAEQHTDGGAVITDAIDLSSMDLRHARLKWVVLTGANLFRANCSGACLGRAELNHANLQEANFSNADLSYANLCRTDLTDANLQCADLSHAILIDANLTGADLRGAKLAQADLTGAQLQGAKLPAHVMASLASTLILDTESYRLNTTPEVTIEMLASME